MVHISPAIFDDLTGKIQFSPTEFEPPRQRTGRRSGTALGPSGHSAASQETIHRRTENASNIQHVVDATRIFQLVAEQSGGVYTQFGEHSGAALREMLSSVAAFSVGGAEGVKRLALPATSAAQQLQRRLCIGAGDGN